VIDYSGTAGQVRTAFHTEIHNLEVDGIAHIANTNDPQIPAALAPAVVGIVALHDFKPHASHIQKSGYTVGNGYYLVAPPDLATIYNFNPVFNGGNTGQGQTIYLLEDSDLYSNSDWTNFRSTFGLSIYGGATLTTIHPAPPSGSNNCSDPGVTGDDGEASLDAEYASAAAPSAAIVMASCTNILTALQNLVNGPNPPAIMSISYGECEAYNGATSNQAFSTAYQTGVAEGMSIYQATGDGLAAYCDQNQQQVGNWATHGVGANGWGSTVYNVAVGGTDFSDTSAGTTSTYWNSSNTSTYASAKSYIPEIPWNNSCGSQLFATYYGYAVTYGSSGFCDSSPGSAYINTHGATGARAAAPPAPHQFRESSAGPARDGRSRLGRAVCWVTLTTACATFPTCRCLRQTASGIIIILTA
jgi:subtilase family serine protease